MARYPPQNKGTKNNAFVFNYEFLFTGGLELRSLPAYPTKAHRASNYSTRTVKLAFVPLLALSLLAPAPLRAQAAQTPSAASGAPASSSSDQRARAILDQMVQALGGSAWLNRVSQESEGRGTTFFHGEPNPYIIEFHETIRYAHPKATPPVAFADRIGFLTDRSMIFPGKKIDVIQIYSGGHGYEVTYKGKDELPKDQVGDYFRRQAHSIEAIVGDWINAPGVMIVYEGQKLIDRHLADQVSVLTAANDAVTLWIDTSSHLPIRRTFQYRDPQFHDFDEESETYDDYHTYQGIMTPMTITRYHNGDMSGQRFLTKVSYNDTLAPDFFDPDAQVPKFKKK